MNGLVVRRIMSMATQGSLCRFVIATLHSHPHPTFQSTPTLHFSSFQPSWSRDCKVRDTYHRLFSRTPHMEFKAFRKMATSTQHDSKLTMDVEAITYLSQADAVAVDELLMGDLGFSVDQLMELAGLSVASAIAEVYKPNEHKRVLVICGPGNNGGDGLVAARHLYHFGYIPFICYPKRTDKPLYHGLVKQLESLAVPFLSPEELPKELSGEFDMIVDAIFGFSFRGAPRPPFDALIKRVVQSSGSRCTGGNTPALVSIDIPSGWNVEQGDIDGIGLSPDMLVSLTAPKLCAKNFKGPHHFLGGRFVPPEVANKFSLHLPTYQGTSMCVRIGRPSKIDVSSLREDYVTSGLFEDNVKEDAIEQFEEWLKDAVAAGLPEPNAMALATVDKESHPSVRMVLLKGFDKRGFVWYTNYQSRKAHELSESPHASLLFFWEPLHRQVRIEGNVERVSDEESDEYFSSRPRGSQIGAVASNQSSVIPGRDALHQTYKELEGRYADREVIPRPNHWGGFRLIPNAIEFWQGQPSRLHDRLLYQRTETNGKSSWKIIRLAP